MIRVLLLSMALAAPAGAFTLPDLAGQWQGEGRVVSGGDPAERLSCRLRGAPGQRDQLVLTGRCATARGGQSFVWVLRDEGEGRIRAEDRRDTRPDELPQVIEGRIGPQGLGFDLPEGGSFELAREGAGFRLSLGGREGGRPVSAEAVLLPRQ